MVWRQRHVKESLGMSYARRLGFSGLLAFFFFSSCHSGPVTPNAQEELLEPRTWIKPGETQASEALRTLGAPTESSSGDQAVFEYRNRPDRLTLQLQAGVVTGEFRTPLAESPESTLQYWRHLWKNEETTLEPVAVGSGEAGAHRGEAGWMQLRAPLLRAAVIYDASQDRVVRVLRYAP